MAQTFKDFILECELYDHSQQRFELLKECSELELTERYLNDQLFMAENAQFISESCSGLEEGFFQESVGESTFEVMTEKYFEKKKGLMGKIMRGLERIIEVFKNFFRKISNKFDDITAKGQEVKKKLASAKLEEADIQKMKQLVADVKSKESSNFPVRANQPYLTKIKLGNYTSTDPEVSKLTNDIAAALSDTEVTATVTLNEAGNKTNFDTIGALPAETIKEAAFRMTTGGESELRGVLATLLSKWKKVHTDGLKIKVNTKEIDNLVDDLSKISTKIAEKGRKEAMTDNLIGVVAKDTIENATGKTIKKPNGEEFTGTEVGKLTEDITAKLTAAVGQTMKLYSSLNGYRSGVISGLNTLLKSQ